MKVAHIVWGFENGGTENMLTDIIHYQSILGNTISLHVINNLINIDILNRIPKNVEIHLYKRELGSKNPLPFLKMNFVLFCERPDIIHLHMPLLKKWIWVKGKFVRTIHSCMSDNADYCQMDALISISESVRNYTLSQNPKYLVETIYNGINVDKVLKKKTFRLRGEALNIVQVSRLQHKVKGQDLVIDAISSLISDNPKINITYTIIGGGESEEYLTSLIHDKHLEDHVFMMGNKSREYIYDHICDYDLFILASRNEGFGLSIVEAMAAKVLVLTSDQKGPLEVIKDGELADVFVTGDVSDLCKKLYDIYNRDTDITRLEKACTYVYENFNVRITADKYLNMYNKILAHK
ncbi:MAG: glycosyltransferase family 4 protein [Salinivirgaceae bacterium]|nr:glycosyltransferase family 4 protein [Salinivirgaceae bacterium]